MRSGAPEPSQYKVGFWRSGRLGGIAAVGSVSLGILLGLALVVGLVLAFACWSDGVRAAGCGVAYLAVHVTFLVAAVGALLMLIFGAVAGLVSRRRGLRIKGWVGAAIAVVDLVVAWNLASLYR